jgi:hypothetical protein
MSYVMEMSMHAAIDQITARPLRMAWPYAEFWNAVNHVNLLFFLITSIIILLLGGLGLLPPDATRATSTEWRGQGEVNVLLRVETDNEGGNVDDLLSNTIELLARWTQIHNHSKSIPDVSLLNEDTGVVNTLGEAELVDTGLQAALQEIFDLEGKHVIELHARFIEHTDTDETANKGVAFEQALGVFLIECEELTLECVSGCTKQTNAIVQDRWL